MYMTLNLTQTTWYGRTGPRTKVLPGFDSELTFGGYSQSVTTVADYDCAFSKTRSHTLTVAIVPGGGGRKLRDSHSGRHRPRQGRPAPLRRYAPRIDTNRLNCERSSAPMAAEANWPGIFTDNNHE